MKNDSQEYLELLARKYKEGTLSEKERADFLRWYADLSATADDAEDRFAEGRSRIKSKIDIELNLNQTGAQSNFRLWRWPLTAAASLLIGCSILLIVFRGHKQHQEIVLAKADAKPGGDRAFLTLGSGQKIDLDTVKTGQILSPAGVHKSGTNQLVYAASVRDKASSPVHQNILTTPSGGQYAVVLEDGTKVWLDAASKLTYPEHFSDTARRVTLEGQAYFEVAHENNRPFRVSARSQTVSVLGTHFNIDAYTDEPKVTTTLAQGLVRVHAGAQDVLIHPGEQAVSDGTDNSLVAKTADLNTELAWKNGLIRFRDASVPQIMRQVARWYNIKIRYVGKQSTAVFSGGFPRSSNLANVLKILDGNNIPLVMLQDGDEKILEVGEK